MCDILTTRPFRPGIPSEKTSLMKSNPWTSQPPGPKAYAMVNPSRFQKEKRKLSLVVIEIKNLVLGLIIWDHGRSCSL